MYKILAYIHNIHSPLPLEYTPAMDTDNMGYEDEYAENYQLQDQGQGQYDMGDGSGYIQNPGVVGSNPNASSLFRSEEMALCQLFLQARILLSLYFTMMS